jgi:hypothetical protein
MYPESVKPKTKNLSKSSKKSVTNGQEVGICVFIAEI